MSALAYTHGNSSNAQVECGVLRADNPLYPTSLKTVLASRAPQELHFMGNIELLSLSGVGFCGSRSASDKGLMTAQDCSQQVSQNGYTVISGYASGVDIVTHRTALETGGTTIIVLPEGMSHFRIKKTLQDVWDWSRILVLSQFKPDEPWQAYRAMSRNQVIIALSKAMIVIEAQEKGGTIEAGKSALKLHVPLFVAEYEDMLRTPGNALLLEHGASRLKKSRSTERASLASVFAEAMAVQSGILAPQFRLL